MDEERVIERVRRLLQLSGSDNQHEAAAATAKAMELLAKYNLSMSSVDQENVTVSAKLVYIRTRKRLEEWAHALAGITAAAFDCRYYHSPHTGGTTFVGVGADSGVCAWTYGYLYKTLLRLASTYLSKECSRLRSSTSKRKARDSFLWGAAAVIQSRLRKQKLDMPITTDALVPVKEVVISAAMPDVVGKHLSPKITSTQAFDAGERAALAVPLSAPIDSSATCFAVGGGINT